MGVAAAASHLLHLRAHGVELLELLGRRRQDVEHPVLELRLDLVRRRRQVQVAEQRLALDGREERGVVLQRQVPRPELHKKAIAQKARGLTPVQKKFT